MKLIAEANPYLHPDDAGLYVVIYEKESEYAVWHERRKENTTPDRYWGHYFPFSNDTTKRVAKAQAMIRFADKITAAVGSQQIPEVA